MEELGRLAFFLVGSIVGYFLQYFFAPYFGEKGKNLATKQDIQEITEKVEGVKASLNVIAQQQMNLFVKRNEALTQFFEDAFAVVTLLRAGFHFSYEDRDGLDKHIRQGQDRIIRAITSCHRLMLYVQEESIITPARNAFDALDTLHGAWFKLALNYLEAFTVEIDEYKRNGRVNSTLSIQAGIELRKGTDDVLDTLDDSLKEYGKALYAHFHPADDSKALAATTSDSPEKVEAGDGARSPSVVE